MKKSKLFSKVLSLLLCAAVVFCALPFSVSAATDGYYTYTVTDGKATITDVDLSISGDVTIPSTLGGYPVVKIGGDAFTNCFNITGVTIPDSVTSICDKAFYSCYSLTSITIPDSVTSIGYNAFENTAYYDDASNWEYDVLYIGNHLIKAHDTISGNYSIKAGTLTIADFAFYYCDKLESITFPDTVKAIGYAAFYLCEKLENVTLPNSVTTIGDYAFYRCEKLENVTLGNGVTTIGDYAFYLCDELKGVTIPDSVTSIGYNAFSGTAYYENNSNWEDDVLYIGKHLIKAYGSISGDYSVKAGTLVIADRAFKHCDKLEGITFPDTVKAIGDDAFYNCEKLESVALGNGVTTIGDCAFGYCEVLKSITIPDTVKTIGDAAFYHCEKLENVTLGNGVTTIGDYAFEKCKVLNSITIPKNVTDIGYNAFLECLSLKKILVDKDNKNYSNDYCGVLLNKDKTELIKYPSGNKRTSYTVPNGVKTIADRAFDNAGYLESVKLPNGIKTIGECTFAWCGSLSSITIPVSVTSIVRFTFYDCDNLADVYYGGSEEAWGKVIVEEYNDPLLDATVHYNTEIVNEVAKTVAVATPSISTIKYGDSIVLHANLDALPDGMSLVWSADNANFEMNVSPDGATCTVTPKVSGSTTFTVTVVDEDGDVIDAESQQLTAKAGFFDKILAFFKNLFGLTKVYPQMLGLEVK